MQAFAFVEIFASAGTCGCNTEQFVEAEAIADIFVEAAASAYAEACVSATLLTSYPKQAAYSPMRSFAWLHVKNWLCLTEAVMVPLMPT